MIQTFLLLKIIIPFVTLYKKIPYQLILLPVISLLISFCSDPKSKTLDEQAIHEYEIELDSLLSQIRDIGFKERHDEFITLYIQIRQIQDILPGTSKLQDSIHLELIPRLEKVGAYEEAIKQSWEYLDRLELKNAGRTEKDGLEIYGLLAGMYNAIGNSDSAYIVYQLAIQKSKQHPEKLHISSALNNMGLYFNNLGKYDSALVHFNLADSVLTAHPDKSDYWKSFHATVRNNMANVYFDLGEYEKAKMHYRENFDFYKNRGSEIGEIYSGISLVNANIGLGNCKGQEVLLNSIGRKLDPLEFSQKPDFVLYLWEVYTRLFQCTGDIKGAFQYQQKGLHLKDSLHKTKEISIFQSNSQLSHFTSEHFKHQLHIEKSEHEKDEQTARLRLWIIILTALGATITPAILYFYYIRLQKEKSRQINSKRLLAEEKLKTRNQEKRLLELELDFRKKDLADLAISLSQKREWASELALKVRLIESSKGYRRSTEFKKLKNEIQSQVHIDKELTLLNQNINKLNKEFYDKLTTRFPGLSKTEVKRCSYFKLNLTNQQVAQLQNIDPSSVKVGRYRLKKKLGLEPDQNLDAFLQSL